MSRDSTEKRSTTPEPSDDARSAAADATVTPLQERDAEPRKRHGDALLDGSGTRHGTDERDEQPEV